MSILVGSYLEMSGAAIALTRIARALNHQRRVPDARE